MSSELQQIISDIIWKSFRNMHFTEKLVEGLAGCVENSIWEQFLENKKEGAIVELDFRVSFKDVTVEGRKREFIVMVNSLVDGKIIHPEIINKIMPMAEEPQEEPICECDLASKLYQEDKVHCAYCGGVIHGE